MLEFKMTTDLQTALPQTIDFNFEELKSELALRLEHYNSLVVTEDTIKEGKADRANLSKLRTAIENRRKEIKNQCMSPYTDFEAKVKELVALIDKPIAVIDSQLKSYEETAKAEKKLAIQDYYSDNVAPNMQAIIPLNKIWRSDWLNATKSLKKVQLEIIEITAKTTADLDFLETMPEDDYTAAVRAKYMETLDITKALNHRNELQEAAKAFKERQVSLPTPEPEKAPEPAREPIVTPVVSPAKDEKLYTLRLELILTKSQSAALKQFLTDYCIEHHKI